MGKLNKSFSEQETKILTEMIKPYKDIENLYRVMFGFSGLFLPLSTVVPFYYFPARYPDDRRKLKVDFKDTELIKNMESILGLIEDNIEKLISLIEEEKKIKPSLFLILLSSIEPRLQPINYDRWAELYWKKQLEGDLSPEEEKEIEALERKNMSTIEWVYQRLKSDSEVQALIERIKGHEWVRVVEGG